MNRDNSFKQAEQTWDGRFSGPDFLFGTEANAYLAQHRSLLVAGKAALAVADGEGRNSVWLARQGLHVDAFDISSVGVAKAARLAREHDVTVDLRVAVDREVKEVEIEGRTMFIEARVTATASGRPRVAR